MHLAIAIFSTLYSVPYPDTCHLRLGNNRSSFAVLVPPIAIRPSTVKRVLRVKYLRVQPLGPGRRRKSDNGKGKRKGNRPGRST